MNDEVHAALEDAVRRRAERDRLVAGKAAARAEYDKATAAVAQARAKLDDEAADVFHLEAFSPVRLWAMLKGSLVSDLDRERAEQEKARYDLAVVAARQAGLGRDLASYDASLVAFADVDTAHDRALSAKEDHVRASGTPAAEELTSIAVRRGELGAQRTELEEALSAADIALQHLGVAGHLFGSARSWADWDLLGGGLMVDLGKYRALDNATSALRDAVTSVGVLSRELADVGMTVVQTATITTFASGFDVWFDNIFSDLSVRSRIVEADTRVRTLLGAVGQIRSSLLDQMGTVSQQLADLDARRTALLRGPVG